MPLQVGPVAGDSRRRDQLSASACAIDDREAGSSFLIAALMTLRSIVAEPLSVRAAHRNVSAYRSLHMTNSVSLFGVTDVALHEAKAQLSALVDHVSTGGGDVIITRRGKPVARLVPIDDESVIESALAHLLAARQASTPGPQSLRELIDEGRR